tara:strand:+ start:839 stop:1915 length:1077 start_codon:yes stop_codon:yes gene_type:complete
MNEIDINDIRSEKDFRSITFSKYKLSDVKKELSKSILNNSVENSLYWSAEIICAGHYKDLWNVILKIVGKNIHLGNIKLPIYLEIRYNEFKELVNSGYVDNELKMRNNKKLRELFAETVSILTLSNKKNSIERSKINKKEFDITDMGHKLKATNITYGNSCFLKDDPKELFIAINEFAYNISPKIRNMLNACYWIEWILEYENICNKKKIKCVCERRSFAPVGDRDQMDIVWIIWDCLLQESTKKEKIIIKTMNSVMKLFSIRFTPSSKRTRIYLLYYAVSLITEPINFNNQILIKDNSILTKIKSKINLIYKQIKKNEEAPKTGYLFKGTEKERNLENTLAKLDKMNNSLGNFIPRV